MPPSLLSDAAVPGFINDTRTNTTEISNYTLAASLAGTVLVQQSSLFSNLFTFVVGGIFASFGTAWQDLLWVSRTPKNRKSKSKKWFGAISPEGKRLPTIRQKALRSNWDARRALLLESPGIVRQTGNHGYDDGELEDEFKGPLNPWWGDWGDLKEETRKMEDRSRLREEAGGHGDYVPSYILEHAPLIHLYSKEEYWPGDINLHIRRTLPQLNFSAVNFDPTLDNLALLNQYAPFIYLTSKENIEDHPPWLSARFNIPEQKTFKCDAPGTLIWIDKGNGIVDAFWFYFYSYNLGNVVFNVRFGNHVGDWEHSMVRFVNGEPKWMFLSQHTGGDAYIWEALEKRGKRPVIYSATGTHANYATPGKQEYIVPLGLLADNTDRGPLWDLTLNSRMYNYNLSNHLLLPTAENPKAPIEWFYFDGRWGDRFYPFNDTRQYNLLGEAHYVSGPLGPRWKNLGRTSVCQRDDECTILTQLRKGRKKWQWEMDPLDGGLDVPWWALNGLDWYLVCFFIVEWIVTVFVIHFGRG